MGTLLTKAERLLDTRMLEILEWAVKNPGWHPIGTDPDKVAAIELLEKRQAIEVWPETKLYRLRPVQN